MFIKAQRKSLGRTILWAFFVLSAISEANANPVSVYWLCRKGMDVRTLRFEGRPDGVCLAWYTKEGIDQKVADSKEGLVFCSTIISKIKFNLEDVGWRCKDISNSQMTIK